MTRSPAPVVPMHKTAYEHSSTAGGYRRLVRRRLMWLGVFVIIPAALVTVALTILDVDQAIPLVASAVLVSLPAIPFAGLGVLGAPRIARILRCYPWRAYPCSYVPRDRDNVLMLALAPDRELEMNPTPYACDLQRKQNDHPDVIWFAGDPACGGVASPAGGHYPQRVVTKRPQRDAPRPVPDAVAERAGLARKGRYRYPLI